MARKHGTRLVHIVAAFQKIRDMDSEVVELSTTYWILGKAGYVKERVDGQRISHIHNYISYHFLLLSIDLV